METREFSNICSICRRTANGYHYDVVSCKGCKTFFRRMCLIKTQVTCDLNNKCFDWKISGQPLLRCRACRFQKCIEAGMNPLAIQLAENETQISSKTISLSTETITQKVIDTLFYVESKLEMFRASAYNPHWFTFQSLQHLINSESKLDTAEKCGPMPGWPLKMDSYSSTPLPSSNMRNIQNEHIRFSSSRKIWSQSNMLTTIEYFKTFHFYHKLSTTDKYILTRHALLACQNLHSSYYAISRKIDFCLQPDGCQDPREDEIHYPVAVMSFVPLIRCQIRPVEYVLLKAICFCNPVVPNLSQETQKILEHERRRFVNILLKYCLTCSSGPSRFSEIVGILSLLEHQQQKQKDLYILHVVPIMSKLLKTNITFLHDIMSL